MIGCFALAFDWVIGEGVAVGGLMGICGVGVLLAAGKVGVCEGVLVAVGLGVAVMVG